MLFRQLAETVRDQIVARTRKSGHKSTKIHCNHWVKLWGDRSVSEITSDDVLNWGLQRKKNRTDATVQRELSFLVQAFKLANRLRLDHQHPTEGHGLKLRPAKRHQWLPYDKQADLMRAYAKTIGSGWEIEWSVADFVLLSGLRRGEQLHLQPHHLTERFIEVPKEGKTGTRLVPMHPRAWEISKLWIKKAATVGSRYVFWPECSCDRLRYGERYALKVWLPAVTAAGMPELQWRDLRRSYGCRLVDNDVSILEVKDLLGHSSVEQTLTYCHIQPHKLRNSVLKLS